MPSEYPHLADFVEKVVRQSMVGLRRRRFSGFWAARIFAVAATKAAIVGGLCRHFEPRWSQSGEPSQVLRGRGEQELVLGATRATQSQAPKSQYAFEMGKQHLYLLSSPTGRFKFRRPSERPSNVAGIFVQIARNLPRHRIRAAPRLEFADVAILLAGAVTARAVSRDAGARRGVGAPELDQLFACRTDIAVSLGIEREVRSRERAVGSRRLIENGNVRRDLLLLDEPGEIIRRTICGVGDEIIRLQAEALFRALQHRSRSADLGLPDGARCFDVDDHSVIRIDQIIGRVGEEGVAFVRAGPLRRGVRPRDELRRHRRSRAERGVIERCKIFARRAARAIETGRAKALLFWEKRAIAVANGEGGNAQTISLALRNRSRSASGWHDAARLEHSGPDGSPLQVQQQATVLDAKMMTTEERATMRQILLAAQARANSVDPNRTGFSDERRAGDR